MISPKKAPSPEVVGSQGDGRYRSSLHHKKSSSTMRDGHF